MATEWYCEIVGEVVGPLKPSQLLTMVRSGEITRDTLIRKDDSQWVPAMAVNGLFDAAATDEKPKAKTLAYVCPYCGASVNKAPTECTNCERYLNRVIPVKETPQTKQATEADDVDTNGSNGSKREKNKSVWKRFWSMD